LNIGSACAMMDSADEKPFCRVRDLDVAVVR
jgi:hypothetical protein